MGKEFSIVFDIAVIAIPLVFAFVGLKRGFAKVVLGLISTLVAFAAAMALSGPISSAIYSKYVEKPIADKLDDVAPPELDDLELGTVLKLDYDKVKINGVLVGEIELDYAGTRKTAVDLSKLDLSGTGLTKAALQKVGIKDEPDLSKLNAKTAEFTMDEVEEYGLGRLAVAQFIAVSLIKEPMMSGFDNIAEKVGEYLPGLLGDSSTDSKGVSALRTMALKMLDTDSNFKETVMNDIVKPNATLVIRTIVFGIIFLLVKIALSIVSAATKLVTKMPVIGKVNSLLGCILGLVEGIIAVFVVCLAIRLVVSLTGANMIMFNQTAIDSTFLFKWLYNFDFLNFVK